jgi:methionyl-tRNA formyltransferase
MRVHFFSGTKAINDAAYDGCSGLRGDVEWRRFALTDKASRDAYNQEAPEADIILSFLNPYVFREEHLLRAGRAYNIHPSTPEHPGQDPQHWTLYLGTFVAGATLHSITRQVDAGPILDVAERSVSAESLPAEIDRQSENMALALLFRRLDDILAGTLEPIDRTWSDENRRKRSDFISMCEISQDMEPEELDRRIRCFHVPTYQNRLRTTIHGRRFIYAGDVEAKK